MAYTLPTFIVPVNIWRSASSVLDPPDVEAVGNMQFGRAVRMTAMETSETLPSYMVAYLLLPKDTDVRDNLMPGGADHVEVPAGSEIFYKVDFVENIARGFTNEHRVAVLVPDAPKPAPLPSGI